LPAASFMLSGCYNSGEPREKVLKIYNWADYIGDGVLEDFQAYYKEQTGEDIRIVYQTFDINEIMLTKIEKGHEDFDVVCPSEYIIERMLKKDLLLPIDTVFPHSPDYMNDVSPYIREQIDKLSQPGRVPVIMPCVTCGERLGYCITRLLFPMRMPKVGVAFGIGNMPARY
jgi:spermidine/putrescine transport system substrate-binding protein